MDIIDTRTEKLWIGKNNIVYCEAKPVEKHLYEDARENIEAAIKLTKGKKHPFIIDIRNARFISSEARELYISKYNSPVEACALIVESAVSKIIGNFFVGLNKSSFPTKLFTSEEKAIEWLSSYNE